MTTDSTAPAGGPARVRRTYTPGAAGERADGLVELASNENPHGASPAAIAATRDAITRSHRYPEHDAGRLRTRIGEQWGLSADHVIVTPGTTPLIDLVARVLLTRTTSAVISERSFLAYAVAIEAAGALPIEVPMRDDTIDLPAIAAASRPDTRLVYLANPNNPTGTAFGRAAFDSFLREVPRHVLVVLDEAYAEYTDGLPEGAAYVREGRRVLALRTFSKVHGLAGLRVGYGLGPPGVIASLGAVNAAFAVSRAAQHAALAALADPTHAHQSAAANRVGRARLTAGLEALGLRPAPSHANFVYVDLGRPADPVRDALLGQGVRVRALASWGAPNALRITVGSAADIDAVLAALTMILRGVS